MQWWWCHYVLLIELKADQILQMAMQIKMQFDWLFGQSTLLAYIAYIMQWAAHAVGTVKSLNFYIIVLDTDGWYAWLY